MDNDVMLDMINNPDNYSKEEIFDAFLNMTEQYLDEAISNMNYEREIIEDLGEEKGNEEIERIASSDPELEDLETSLFDEEDAVKRIYSRLDYLSGGGYGLDIGGNEK